MPNSYVEYSSGLTETTYSIPFNYIAIADVSVKGFDGSDWSDLTVASRDASAKTVTLDVAPSAYQKIRVWRNTSTEQLVDFQNGSRLSERDLDTAYQQGLFVAQEVSENASTEVEGIGPQGPQGIQGEAGADPFDDDGNLLVGKTSSGVSNVGAELRDGVGDYAILGTSSGYSPLILNRTSSDGKIAVFRKDNSDVGTIGGSQGTFGYLWVGSGPTGLRFDNAFDNITPVDPSSDGVTRDNAIDLGASSGRFDDIYATNGTIQTSDANDKQDIETLTEAEQRVAVACKGLLRKFRWKSSVEEKGEEARIHFGIIAQDLKAAFEAEGLDAGRYAMFTSSTWTDEDSGEEKTRLGVRYSELLAFIISAI